MITGNTHFAIATHVMAVLAIGEGKLVTSDKLAFSVSTNPAFLRVVLGRLRDAGIVHTKRGKAGGSTLARPPDTITLLEVFRAIEGKAELTTHDCAASACPVGRRVPAVLDRLSHTLDAALAHELEQVLVSDIADEVRPN